MKGLLAERCWDQETWRPTSEVLALAPKRALLRCLRCRTGPEPPYRPHMLFANSVHNSFHLSCG